MLTGTENQWGQNQCQICDRVLCRLFHIGGKTLSVGQSLKQRLWLQCFIING